MPKRVLFIDDDQDLCETVAAALKKRGFRVTWSTTVEQALDAIDDKTEAVVADLRLGDESGLDVCTRLGKTHPDLPVIVLTGFGTMEDAISAIRAGAYDFLNKPVEMEVLALRLERAVERHRLGKQLQRLEQASQKTKRASDELLGKSRAMKKLREMLERVTDTDASVLIVGESGTGKELVARALHEGGARATGPFVALNCAAVPESLLESTLFGHVQGAFTDAKRDKKGLLVEADGGTVLLDEIGEMPPPMQAKLLRALQDRKVRPVGGSREIGFDVRILASTHRDLEQYVREGRFREDLYFRINVITIEVPSLRERNDDILLLAQGFLERVAEREGKAIEGLTPEAADALLHHDWPGNVRELENAIERAVAIGRYDHITLGDLPESIAHSVDDEVDGLPRTEIDDRPSLRELERRYVRLVLRETDGNVSRAAKILDVSPSQVRAHLEEG